MRFFLIGFMGTGKSTIGALLAEELQYTYHDLDEVIVFHEAMSISKIFQTNGESYFRDLESDYLKKILDQDNIVVATGGGVVLREENVDHLKEQGTLICLQATPQSIFERIKDTKGRPLLAVDDPLEMITSMLEKRAPYYACADLTIDTDGKSPREIVEEIYMQIGTTL